MESDLSSDDEQKNVNSSKVKGAKKEKPAQPLTKRQELNDHIVDMRKCVRQARVQTINRLVNQIKRYRNRKGSSKEQEKGQRKAKRILEEIQVLKKIKEDKVSLYALQDTQKLDDVLNNSETSTEERVLARLSHHNVITRTVQKYRKDNPNWDKQIPVLVQMTLEKRNNHKKGKNPPENLVAENKRPVKKEFKAQDSDSPSDQEEESDHKNESTSDEEEAEHHENQRVKSAKVVREEEEKGSEVEDTDKEESDVEKDSENEEESDVEKDSENEEESDVEKDSENEEESEVEGGSDEEEESDDEVEGGSDEEEESDDETPKVTSTSQVRQNKPVKLKVAPPSRPSTNFKGPKVPVRNKSEGTVKVQFLTDLNDLEDDNSDEIVEKPAVDITKAPKSKKRKSAFFVGGVDEPETYSEEPVHKRNPKSFQNSSYSQNQNHHNEQSHRPIYKKGKLISRPPPPNNRSHGKFSQNRNAPPPFKQDRADNRFGGNTQPLGAKKPKFSANSNFQEERLLKAPARASIAAPPAEKLHPSWEAKKKQQQISLTEFKGKKIVFGDDED